MFNQDKKLLKVETRIDVSTSVIFDSDAMRIICACGDDPDHSERREDAVRLLCRIDASFQEQRKDTELNDLFERIATLERSGHLTTSGM